MCFDAGLVNSAYNHFCHALVLAGLARADGLTANVCYRLGRVFLHHGHFDEVLRYFDVGRLAASRSSDGLAASILSVNTAWVCAKKGAEHDARTLLDRGQEQFAATNARSRRTPASNSDLSLPSYSTMDDCHPDARAVRRARA